MNDDAQLLRCYVEEGSESAFGELVSRHIDLVYSAALRLVGGDAHLAQDVTQSVFADLARKARSLSNRQVLTGWLYQATRYAAAKAVRTERRRAIREKESVAMQEPSSDAKWEQLSPLLDEAMGRLGAKDRDAVLLRYFERKELRAVGDVLGTSEEAARKRVGRALARLRRFLMRRGVTLPATALAAALAGNAVQAAPAALAGAISAAVVAGAAAAGSAFSLLNLMSMTKLKAGLLGAAVVVGAGTPIVVQQRSLAKLRAENQTLLEQSQQIERLRAENQQLAGLRAAADEAERLRNEVAELHRLRAEVARLRRAGEGFGQLQGENARLNAHLKLPAADDARAQADSRGLCLLNLRIIEGAKDQWALEHKKGIGTVVNPDELADYCKDNVVPTCPGGGTYTLNQIGQVSSCSVHGSLPRDTTSEELAVTQQQFNDRVQVLPLIQFEDAPLHDALLALARQAKLNVVFDPKVEPLLVSSLTIRLENLTAGEALEAILSTNNLRMVKTPGTTWKRSADVSQWPGDVVGITRK